MHLGGICFSGLPSDDHELALCPRNHGISSVRIRPMKEGTANRIASSRCQERRMFGSCWLGRAAPKKYRANCNSQYSRTIRHEALLLHRRWLREHFRACFLRGFGPGFSKRNWFRSLMACARIRPFRRQSEIVFVETSHCRAISNAVSMPRSRSRSKRLLSP